MEVYLAQHGEATPKTVDRSRPLSDQGRMEVERVAALAARMGLVVGQIRHSGKTRAEQTAAIIGGALAPAGGVVAVDGLAPLDDVQPVAEMLRDAAEPVMLVGHLPFMARLAGVLLADDPDIQLVRFRMGGILCLARENDRWQVAWVLTPEMTRTT